MKPSDKIWLEPECDECDERCWSCAPFDDCEECGKETIGYVRDDIVLAASQEASRMFNRIEKLEAALRDIIDERGICGHCGQLATGEGKRSFVICDKTVLGFKGPCHWTPQDPKDIASKALEGKDE